jgi:hypothetical protein
MDFSITYSLFHIDKNHFHINIKRLLDNDFLVGFFFGLTPGFGLDQVSGHAG